MSQGRHAASAPALEPSLNIRRQARSHHPLSHQKVHFQPTMHAASGSGLPRRKAFGPTSAHPGDRVSKLLGASSLDQIIFLPAEQHRRPSDLNNEGMIFGRVGDAGGQGGNLLQGGMLTNIRVAGRDGKDELHVQLSTELRKAQNLHQQQQLKIDLLVAKEEDHLSKISGLEAAHGRLRKTLKTTESNLETHALEAKQRIDSLQTMLIATQRKLTIATGDCARERSLRIQKQKQLESRDSDYNILKIRHDELVNRLAMVADLEKNGTTFQLEKEKLKHDYTSLKKTHEIILSEAEELRQRLGMAEEEILQQRALRRTLYMLMGDLRTPGVRPPKRVAGGYSTYPRPAKRNVAKAVKLIVDGEIAEAWAAQRKKKRRPKNESGSGHLKKLRELKETRSSLEAQGKLQSSHADAASVDTPSITRFLKSLFGQRSLFGKKITSAGVLFKIIDRDHSGTISKEELIGALTRLDSGLTLNQITTLVATFDDDKNGMIDREEFLSFFSM